MPSFASTDGPKSAIPIKNYRYQIPRYPFQVPMPEGTEPTPGTGMLVPYTRVSTLLDTHEDKEGLIKWKARLVAKGLASRPDLYALAAATRLEDKRGLSQVVDQAFDYAMGQASANLGSALHGFLERWFEGDKDLVIPDPWKADVAAVLAAFQEADITVATEYQEVCVVRPDLKDGDAEGLAGRFDLLVWWKGHLTMADYKTGSDPMLYGSWKIQQQLGVYPSAWAIWDGTYWRPMPVIRRDKALMIHVLPGQASAQIIEVDIDPDVLEEDLQAAYRTRRRRREAKKAHRPIVTVEEGTVLADASDLLQPAPDQAVVSVDLERGPAIGPLNPTPAAAERAAANVARVAAASSPNTEGDDDPVSVGQAIAAAILDETARNGHTHAAELAPLAGPGERGCSVCGRTKHRKGSPKCLGENDPRFANPASISAATAEQTAGHTEHEWAQNPETGTWYCAIGMETSGAPQDGPSIETPEEAAAVPTHCRCTARARGWTAPADGEGPWVCGDCGLPSVIGTPLAVQTGEQASTFSPIKAAETGNGWGEREDRQRQADADRAEREQTFPGQVTPEELDEGHQMVDTSQINPMLSDHGQPDPFEEDSPTLSPAEQLWHEYLDKINEAKDRAELRAIRADAMSAGVWDKQLTQAGLARIATFKS